MPSGGGAKYESGGILFWSKGDEATFEQEGKSTSCRVAEKDLTNAARKGQLATSLEPNGYCGSGAEMSQRRQTRSDLASHQRAVYRPQRLQPLLCIGQRRARSRANYCGSSGRDRMACPEPVMAVEARFLEQLGRVKRFGFLGMRLALSYYRMCREHIWCSRRGGATSERAVGTGVAVPEPKWGRRDSNVGEIGCSDTHVTSVGLH